LRLVTDASTPAGSDRRARGAYGLRLGGLVADGPHLGDADPGWPAFALANRVEVVDRDEDVLAEGFAKLRLRTGGEILIDRAAGTAEYVTPRTLSVAELVHPFLAPVAAVAAWWFDRQSFHGGAFVARGGAYGVLADRERGKSSTLALLAARGVTVLADDLVVVDDGACLAGPRAIDLRDDAAKRLGVGEYVGVLGARERWRVPLAAAPGAAPLRGWVFLDWGGELALRRLTSGETTAQLLANVGLRVSPRRPEAVLDLALLPAWRLERPRAWASADAAVDALLDAVG
jgi:hypothetical protein